MANERLSLRSLRGMLVGRNILICDDGSIWRAKIVGIEHEYKIFRFMFAEGKAFAYIPHKRVWDSDPIEVKYLAVKADLVLFHMLDGNYIFDLPVSGRVCIVSGSITDIPEYL